MSNLEPLVLELFGRVKDLEKKVDFLESALTQVNENEKKKGTDSKKITRSDAQKYLIEKISQLDPSAKVIKGNRSTPGDVVIKKNDGQEVHVKLYYSRSYNKAHPSSWHTLKESEVLDNHNVDFFIFVVSFEEAFHTFIFRDDELKNFVKDKDSGNAKLYHFYFHIVDGKPLEVRDGEKEVSDYYERWSEMAK